MTTSAGRACEAWDSGRCAGSPYCPPRCPRFVDAAGVPHVVRPYRAEDRPALVAMYEDLDPDARTLGLPPASRWSIEAWLSRLTANGWNLVSVADDRVAGHVGVAPTTATDPEFVVFVHQDFRNRGLGTELLGHTIAYAADGGYDELTLSVSTGNRRAIHVYRNVGFEPEADDRARGRRSMDLAMRLPLSHPIADLVRLPPAER